VEISRLTGIALAETFARLNLAILTAGTAGDFSQ
jgi:hypothetical protein